MQSVKLKQVCKRRRGQQKLNEARLNIYVFVSTTRLGFDQSFIALRLASASYLISSIVFVCRHHWTKEIFGRKEFFKSIKIAVSVNYAALHLS